MTAPPALVARMTLVAEAAGFGGKDDPCRRGTLEGGIAPRVARGSGRARPTGPTAPAQSGGRTSP
jgi:hypothetical protein